MTVQKRIAQFGLAKQTAKGTAATSPTYVIGLAGGSVYDAEISENELNTTWSDRLLAGHERIETIPGQEADFIVTPKMIGLILFAALGADAVTGTGPYVHTLTPSNTIPWMTVFGSYGTDKATIADAKIDSVELSWDKSGAVKGKLKSMGRTLTFASTWTGGTAEGVVGNTFSGNGGVFTVAGTTARVVSGSIKIENGLAAVTAAYSTTPDEIVEAMVKCDVSLTIVPDDLTLFRTTVTGSSSGTTAQSAPQYGAVDLKFLNGTNSLEFTASQTKYAVKMPDVDPAGGAAEVAFEGSVAQSFAFILTNSVATY